MRRRDIPELIRTGAAFCLLVILMSVAGWCCIPERPVPTPTLVDKQWLKLKTAQALAESTAIFNADMERRARGGK